MESLSAEPAKQAGDEPGGRWLQIPAEAGRLLNLVSNAIIVRDSQDRVTYWNKGAEQLYGYTAEEALGKHKFTLLQTQFPEPLEKILTVLNRDGHWRGELVHTHRKGHLIRVLARWSLDRGPDGNTRAVLESIEDITQRRMAEEALRESEQRYRLLFTNNPDGVFLVDAQGRFVMVNPACEALSGYNATELLGRHFAELCAPDQLHKTLQAFEKLLQDPSYTELETALVRKDGVRVELWIAGEPLMKDGAPLGVHCTAKDVTERNEFQAKLERLVNERTVALKKAVDQLNSFVYALAHDFKAPLRAQSGFARVLLEDFGEALGKTGCSVALRIAEAAERQQALVTGLLEQVSLSREDLPLEPVNLRDAVTRAQADLAFEIQERNATVGVGSVDGLVWANPACLHLILTNLLSNALKFVPEGVNPQISIWSEVNAVQDETSPKGSDNDPIRIRLWIQDNGIGIPEEDKPRLFQAFQRLHSDSQYPGTGIGLAIVKKAIERLSGALGVESKPGLGSRFWIELRAAVLAQQGQVLPSGLPSP